MNLEDKTKGQLIEELDKLHRRMNDLETRMENALYVSEERFRALAENTSDWVWEVDADGSYTYASPRIADLLGYSPQEVIGKTPFDLMLPEESERVARIFWDAVAAKKPITMIENVNLHKDGREVVLETSGKPFFDDTGKLRGYRGINRDISERKKAEEALREARNELEQEVEKRTGELLRANARLLEEIRDRKQVEKALRESEERLELALAGANLGLWDWHVKTDQAVINKRAAEIVGYELDEVEARFGFWESLLHPEDRPRAVEALQSYLKGRTDHYADEYRVKTKSGEWKWLYSLGRIVERDPLGGPLRIVGTYRDITNRKRAADALKEREQFLTAIVENIPDMIFVKDAEELRFVRFNKAGEDLLGYSRQELMGKNAHDFFPKEEADYFTANDREILETGVLKDIPEETIQTRHKGSRILHTKKIPLYDENETPRYILGISEDITDRKKAEDALRESERRYGALLNSTTDLAFLKDEAFRYIMVNKANQEFFGKPEIEIIGKTDFELMPPGAAERCRLSDVEALDRDGIVVAEEEVGERIFETKKFAVALGNGQIGLGGLIREVTERKRAEQALRESEERYRTIVDLSPMGIFVMVDKCFVYANESFLNILGVTKDTDVIGKPTFNYLHPDCHEIVEEHIATIMETGRPVPGVEEKIARWDGTFVNVEVAAAPIDFGGRRGILVIVSDITDRKLAEDALRESQQKYRMIFEHAPLGILHFDHNGVMLDFNDKFVEMMGAPREKLVGFHMTEGQKDEQMRQAVLGALSGKTSYYEGDYRSITGGKVTSTRALYGPQLSADGVLLGGVGIFEDITKRKHMERALKESEHRYRAIFNIASVGIDLVDQQGRFLEVNNTLSQFLGYSPEELRRFTIFDVTHPQDVDRSIEMHEAMILGQTQSYRLEKRYVRKDGSILWADTAVSAIRDADGQYRATVGVVRDITQGKESEEVRIRLAAAVEQAAETVVITNAQGTIVYANPAFERTTGYSCGEAIGQNLRVFKSGPHDDEIYKRMWDTITEGKIWTGHITNKKKDGTLFEEDASISPVKDDSGKITNFVAVKRDVTREISLQKQLLQAQKMEAIGTLAGGIAHDFNNILQVALGYSELLLTGKSGKDPDYSDLQKIYHAAHSGAELVRNLLTFSRKVEPKPVPMDLNNQVRNVAKLLGRTIPRMIDIQLELAENLKRTNSDPGQIEQIIMNLAVNAKDAMGESGSLMMRTENVSLDEEYCLFNAEAKPGDYVLLSVSDTGHGMERETLQHIFEPFYTTKELGRGTGLGLAMVYGIVKQHNGYIICESEVGRGTTFKIFLPAIAEVSEPDVASSGEMTAFGTETVLLVDDEEFVRELGARILSKAGYKVLTATNGREGADLFERERTRISLVILDLIMPEIGGAECLKELRTIDPHLKVIIASGLSTDLSKKESIEMGARGYVSKPFRMKELLRQVRKALDSDG